MTCIFKLSRQATVNTEAVQPRPRNKEVYDIPIGLPFQRDPKNSNATQKSFLKKTFKIFFKKKFPLEKFSPRMGMWGHSRM